MAYGFEDQEYYYDPAGQMTVEPAGSSTVVSGIGSPAATVAAQPVASTTSGGSGGLGSYQLSDPSLATPPDWVRNRDPSLNRINWGGNYDPVTGRLGVLPFFVGGSEAQDASYYAGGDTSNMAGYAGPLETGLPTYQISTAYGRPVEDYIVLNPSNTTPTRLIDLTTGEVLYEGPGASRGLIEALDKVTAEGNQKNWAIQSKAGDAWQDTYRQEPIGNLVRDVALPLMATIAGGAGLAPLLGGGTLGLAAGVGLGSAAGNIAAGNPVDESIIKGLTAAATAAGGAGLGPVLGLGSGALGAGAGAASANLAANLVQGKSIEDSLKSAAIAGITAGVIKSMTGGGSGGGKTGDFTNAEIRAADELSKATGLAVSPVKGYTLNTAGQFSTPDLPYSFPLADAARVVANVGSLSGVEEAIIVTARSLGISLADATTAALSNAINQAFDSVNPEDVAKIKEDTAKATDEAAKAANDAAARVRQEEIARMGDESSANTNAREAGFPEGFEVYARGPSLNSGVMGDVGGEINARLRGDVYDRNLKLVTRDWYNLSDAQKAAIVAKANADFPTTPIVTGASPGGAAAGTAAGATAGIGGTTLDNVTITGSTPSADTAAGTGAGAVAGIDNTAPPATVSGETTGDTATAGGTAGAVAGIGGTTLDNVTVTGSTPGADTAAGTGAGAVAGIGGTALDNVTVTNTVPGGGGQDTVVAGIGNDIVSGTTVTNTVPGGGRDDTVPGGTTLDNITVTNTVPGGGRDDTVPGGRDDDIIIVENPPTTPPTTPPAPPRTRTVSSILDLGTPEAVVQNQRLRERLALDAGIGKLTYEDLLDLGEPEALVENRRLRERLALTPGVGTVNYESVLNLGPQEVLVQNQRMREQLALAPIVNTVVDPLDLGLPSKVINVTERRNPLTVSATPGSPTVLSEVLSVTPQDIINVTNQRNRIAPAPTATGSTTQRVTLNAQGEPEIRVSQQRNQVAPAPNVTGPRTERVTLNAQGEPETVVTGERTGLPVNILPPTDPVQDILDSVDPEAPQKRTVLSTLKQISGLVPLIGLLGDAIGGDDDGGGVIDRGTGYATPTYGRQRNFYNDDPFTYGQRSGELRFFGNRTLLDPGLPPPTTTTTAGGGTAPPPPAPAGPYVPTAADIQAAFPGFTDIRQDDQGRWYGTPLADFKPSGQPLPTGRVTAAGSYTPSVEQVTYFNPGFESITRNAAGEFVGSRTEQLDAPPALTVEQVRARNPGYDSYEKNAQGQWVGIRAGTTPPPITEAQIREQFPGYDRYEQDAQGNWSGVRNASTTTQRPATEAQVRAQNPNYDAYEQDANGQWVGIKNIAGTTTGAMTEAQVRAANPDYDAFEQDASGGWYGIKNVQTSTPRAATEAQVRATNPNYDAYEQDANGQWVGIKNIAGTTSGVLTEAQVRAANPDYDAYEQDPSGEWYGIKSVETRTPSTLTLDQVRAQYGSNYDSITQNENGQFVGTRMLPGQSTPMTPAQVRAAFPQYSRIEQLPTGEYYGITEVQEETPIPFTLADARARFGSQYSNITQNPQGRFMGTRTFTRAPTLQEVRGLGLGYEDFEQDEAGNYFGIRNVETRTPVPFTLADAQARFGSQYGNIYQDPQRGFVGVNTARFERPLTIDEVRRLAPGYQDYEQGDGGFYGIRNVETRTPVPYTLADAQQRFGSQYSNIYQDPQRGFVGVGTREVPRAPTIEDAQRQYGSAYDAYEQGDEGIYGIRNTTTTIPGAPYTLADARARFGSQYGNIYQNEQGQFVGEKTEAEPTFAEGGEVYDDMVSHLISYRKGGGHMGPGKVSGIGSGQEDKIPAWLSDGEYVWSAQDVADLGDGSTDEGVRRLDRMRQMVRKGAGRKDVKKIAKPQRGIEDMLKAVGGKV